MRHPPHTSPQGAARRYAAVWEGVGRAADEAEALMFCLLLEGVGAAAAALGGAFAPMLQAREASHSAADVVHRGVMCCMLLAAS
jgi:hypothetical protein